MVAQIDFDYFKTRPLKGLQRLTSYALFEGRPLTTSGRWINPLVFTHLAVEKKLPRLKKVEKPIFIIGAGRSGTTLLGILLSMHRNVGYLNEPKALWHSIYSTEDVIGSYANGPAFYRLDETSVDDSTVENAHRLYGAYLRLIGAQRVVDKYPELVFRVSFVRSLFPDARFIFLSRNGWDTAASIEKWSQRKGSGFGKESLDWWGKDRRKWNLMLQQLVAEDPDLSPVFELVCSLTKHEHMALVEWIVSMREGLDVHRKYPDDVMWLRYEDLTINPIMRLDELLRFCDLPEDKVFMHYALGIIKPNQGHKRIDIPDFLQGAFSRISSDLGYAGMAGLAESG